MTKHPKAHPVQAIEDLIDRYGLGATLSAIIDICDAKAEHVAMHWRDVGLAKSWAVAAQHIADSHVAELGL